MPCEEAEQRRLPVVLTEAFEELGVRDDATPARGDEGGARKGQRLRREAEKDLPEEVLIVQRGIGRHRGMVAAANLSLGWTARHNELRFLKGFFQRPDGTPPLVAERS
jgi:hypothetical protein